MCGVGGCARVFVLSAQMYNRKMSDYFHSNHLDLLRILCWVMQDARNTANFFYHYL